MWREVPVTDTVLMVIVPGARLGPYEIMSPLGSGGMGEVYKARDMRLGRVVAVKVLAGRHAEDAAMRERFEREARAISALSHPLICTLFDVGEHEGVHFCQRPREPEGF